jgi:hypothetical protein
MTVSWVGSSTFGSADGTGTSAQFNGPSGLAFDSVGNAYVCDEYNHLIRKITPSGVTSTLAGSGAAGYANGAGTSAIFNLPTSLGLDASGNVFVMDSSNYRIRKVSPTGVVTTFAGSGAAGTADGVGTSASFDTGTQYIAVDSSGNVYVSETNTYQRIRKITPAGSVSTLAGSTAGWVDGAGTNAKFSNPRGLVADTLGNVYVADHGNFRIRKITPSGVVSTLAAGGSGRNVTCTGAFLPTCVINVNDGTGTAASFYSPSTLALDQLGNMYVDDDNRIRIISPSGVVSTIAGNGTSGIADGIGTATMFYGNTGIAVDASGNVYVTVAFEIYSGIRKIMVPVTSPPPSPPAY